ncbi:MAG: tRNA 2-thiouridine(34) synthase MnmA [Actinomycetota bacterium]
MKVLVAMSGGVDSSVAAALLRDQGHEVVGVTMRLWGGESDTGCCSVSDVDDARRVAQQLGIDHLVFNFTDDFHRSVVDPYVHDHRYGITPNPCIECNRHVKFDRLYDRALLLGFDAVATGHHARVERRGDEWQLRRGVDLDKDQSYVVHMLDQERLARTLFPVGSMTKAEVRTRAAELGLRTADKPDSQDVCFITSQRAPDGRSGRVAFLGRRIPLHEADVVDESGQRLGSVDAVELVTIGQRRGVAGGGGVKRFVVDVDVPGRRVTVGPEDLLMTLSELVGSVTWANRVRTGPVLVQCSAHGRPQCATLDIVDDSTVRVRWDAPQRRVSPGQSAVFYSAADLAESAVIGGGSVLATSR